MPPYTSESWGKESHDLYLTRMPTWVEGAIIVGAGPSGMAAAACLKEKGIKSILLEKADCLGSLWKHKTYDRLHLHLPKQFCQLPFRPFPDSYPMYPNRQQFLDYLEDYARHFNLEPHFNEAVVCAKYDDRLGAWRVNTKVAGKSSEEYMGRWLIVASGENAEVVTPTLPGLNEYLGSLIHSSLYRNGVEYTGKKVLVVGCGNSGMEIALDLTNHKAKPSLVVRGPVHVLPRDMFGRSTFSVALNLMKAFPVWLTDWLLVFYTWLTLGNVASYGFMRPKEGPMELKSKVGKSPILDVGTFNRIKSGEIVVVPRVSSVTKTGVLFENGQEETYDAIILATGYRSNVPTWLKGEEKFFTDEGVPTRPFPNGWKGERGLYAVGFSRRGLLGASFDAKNISEDIAEEFSRVQRSEKSYVRPFRCTGELPSTTHIGTFALGVVSK